MAYVFAKHLAQRTHSDMITANNMIAHTQIRGPVLDGIFTFCIRKCHLMFCLSVLLMLVIVCGESRIAHAQDEKDQDYHVGETKNALPGLVRVGVIENYSKGMTITGTTGYGYTEDVLKTKDKHNRFTGSLAAGLRLAPWFAASLELDGRYDKHSSVPNGTDDGFVGNPRINLRAGKVFNKQWGLGVQSSIWLPGNDAPSIKFNATTIDLQALASYHHGTKEQGILVATHVGYRLDNSDKSISNADLLSRADRLALGVSGFNAIMIGAGVQWHKGPIEIMGEWTWDKLTGSGLPSSSVSPMFASLGGRFRLDSEDAWRLFVVGQYNFAKRPVVDVGQPLIVVDPKISAHVGVSYRFSFDKKAGAVAGAGAQEVVEEKPTQLNLKVVDGKGIAISDAAVELEGPETRKFISDENGELEITELTAGHYIIRVVKDGYSPLQSETDLKPGAKVKQQLKIEAKVAAGFLRGFVRSFSGEGLVAEVRIPALNMTVTTGDDGSFELQVPPGSHEVMIKAAGYAEQKRKVEVEEDGVVLLNVDMRRTK